LSMPEVSRSPVRGSGADRTQRFVGLRRLPGYADLSGYTGTARWR
jgi:hypothetical protein